MAATACTEQTEPSTVDLEIISKWQNLHKPIKRPLSIQSKVRTLQSIITESDLKLQKGLKESLKDYLFWIISILKIWIQINHCNKKSRTSIKTTI